MILPMGWINSLQNITEAMAYTTRAARVAWGSLAAVLNGVIKEVKMFTP